MSEERREGRGRLSSIDMLPDEATPDVVWALEQLRAGKLPQTVIFAEFNERLADKGLGPISKSAFNRYSVRKAIQFKKLDNAQRMAGELVDSLGPGGPDQVTVAVAEMLKVAAFEILEGGEVSSKGIMELSRALSSAVAAQKVSAEHRKRLEEEARDKAVKAIDDAAGKASPDQAEVLKRIRQEVYGIFEKGGGS
jgi:tape measure domain-containing protein